MLRAQLVKLAVLFTCDRARSRPTPTPPGEILAEYRGREHVAVMPIDERAPLDCTDEESAAVLAPWIGATSVTVGRASPTGSVTAFHLRMLFPGDAAYRHVPTDLHLLTATYVRSMGVPSNCSNTSKPSHASPDPGWRSGSRGLPSAHTVKFALGRYASSR